MTGRPVRSGRILLAYVALSIAMTWPLALGLTRDVPGDLGDALLNMWILGWGAEQVPRVLSAQVGLTAYWNANIFHPEPLALSLSEHLFGQVIQILPIYWLTGNLILCYNLLFISSFALSGFAMFLLVRELATDGGGARATATVVAAAFVAGLVYAFLPFRLAQVAHIQSLSSQWMPLALYGFVRYIRTARRRALAGGTFALLMQNWSCGYYLIFFAPFVPMFVLHQLWSAGRLRDWRLWSGFAASAAVVTAGTWPFLALYREAQRVHGVERSMGEVIRFSADVYSYLTAPETLRVWGAIFRAYPKAEGELFFGVMPWLLILFLIPAVRPWRGEWPLTRPAWLLQILLVCVITIQSVGLVLMLLTGGFVTSIAGLPVRATNPLRILTGIGVATLALLALSAGARARLRAAIRSPAALALVLTLLAMWLSLGPMPQSMGRPLPGLGLYELFYERVPGFAGLRVPARYGMIAGLFLAVAAGLGALRFVRWTGPVVGGIALSAAILVESAFAPMPLNLAWGDGGVPPPPRVEPAPDAPAVYHQLARMPDDTVVAEFPFGDPAWELRYVYYSTVHWKRLINGYSGAFPRGYQVRVASLQRLAADPAAAWRALRDAGTTHVVVHEEAFRPGEAAVVTKWLDDHFAVEIARFDGDVLYDVSGVWPPR